MDIQERKTARFRFLNELFEQSEGDEHKLQKLPEIARAIGMDKEEAWAVARYLQREGLLDFPSISDTIGITHEGINQIEAALSSPDDQTTYFPPVNVINIGNMSGGAIQQGTVDSVQVVIMQPEEVGAVTRLLAEIRRAIEGAGLADADSSDLRADLDTIEAQLRSSQPKRSIVRECLVSARAVLEAAAGTVIGAGITQQLASIIDSLSVGG